MKIAVFSLADKEYGADIAQVREVLRMRKVVPVPDVPGFIEGVISLRGKVIPLVNLRKKLGYEPKPGKSGRILVTKTGDHWIAILVDEVRDVVTLGEEDITQPDEVLQSARYLKGVAKLGKNLVLIVDLTELLKNEERDDLKKLREKVELKKRETA